MSDNERTYGENITYVAISPDGSIAATFNPYTSSISIEKVVKNDVENHKATDSKSTDKSIEEVMNNDEKIEKATDTTDKSFISIEMAAKNDEKVTYSKATKTTIKIDIKKFFDKKPSNIIGWSLAVSDIIDKDIGLVAISCITEEDMNSKRNEEVNNLQILLGRIKQLLQNFVKLSIPYCLIFFFLIFIIFLSLPIILSASLLCLFVLLNLYYFIRLCTSYYVASKDDIEQFRLSFISSNGIVKLFKFSFSNYANDDNNSSIYLFGGVVSFLKNSKNSFTLICMNYTKIQKLNINLYWDNYVSEEGSYLLPENLFDKLESIRDAKLKWKYLSKLTYQEFLIVNASCKNKRCIELYNINTLQLVNVFRTNSNSNDNEPGIFAISTDSRLFAYSYGNHTITIYLMESGLKVVSRRFCNKIKFLEFIEKDKKLFIIDEDEEDGKSIEKFYIWVLSGLDDHLVIEHNTSILSNYDCLTKANGMVVFLDNKNNIGNLHNLINNGNSTIKSNKHYDYEESFKRFKDLYTKMINYENKPELDEGMAIIIACKFLAHLYDNRNDQDKSIDSNHQELVNEIINFIKDFIKYCPDHWSFLEVQYPLMAYLIYSRSFSLIKYILFKQDYISYTKDLHRPQNKYVSYPYYNDLKLYDDLKLKDDANDLELALNFRQGRDAIMLAYLLEYYSKQYINYGEIGWMINVTKILPKLSADYMESLYYLYFNKNGFISDGSIYCDGRYNFSIRRFKIIGDTLNLKIYIPLTQLIPANSSTFFEYNKIRDGELDNFYIVPNFTTYNEKIEEKSGGIFSIILYWLRKIFLPPGYKNLDYKGHKSFLYIESKDIIFDNPFIEAVMTSRWRQAKIYWTIPLIFYIIFLFLFSFLSQLYLSDNDDKNKYNATFMTMVGIFYYVGIYLLTIEFTELRKYKIKYLTLFNVFDLCSIILGVIVFTLIFVRSFNEIIEINNEGIVILLTVTTLILWIEMLLWLRLFTEVAVYIYIFGNILKKIIPFFVFMIILTIGFGHSMFVLFGHPSLLDLNPSASTYTLDNGTTKLKLTGEIPENPFDTIWDAILSTYYWNTINFSGYDYWPLKLFAFIANVILVLILLNMIIALMNDTFNKAKEDANLGLVTFRAGLIDEYERLDNSFFRKLLHSNSPYICFHQNHDIMEKWIEKTEKKFKDIKLYSLFDDDKDKSWLY
ncbi:unnamed protein product [Rhizophagus irregularis]|uniref:Ion transport domain-containing protein n=1 Tax=Rhizophagus irregularis TaxID=588596 RepID=A0A2I1EXM7_9GLOM|nr:hypothetical protein RhiirB3_442323 [Rhizophagus irregularis]CAB5346731.1 unnamed protein product [Rhizophagus irregularis]